MATRPAWLTTRTASLWRRPTPRPTSRLTAVNDVGWKLAITNALGQGHVYNLDLNGNAVRIVDPLQRVLNKTYDANGNLLSASDAKGQFTTYAYDPANQRTSMVDRTGTNMWRNTYTSRGELEHTTDPLGNTATNCYDAANRLDCRLRPARQFHYQRV